jgi:hypothetical protein
MCSTTEYKSARLSLQSSELDPPAPSGGGTHSLAGKGAGEPVRTKGETLWYMYSRYSIRSLYMFIVQPFIVNFYSMKNFDYFHPLYES